GLYRRRGALGVGADADIAIWDPARTVRLSSAMLHDRAGYTPYEGRSVTGWPETVLSRGRVAVRDGRLHVAPGSGRFLPRAPGEPAQPLRPPPPAFPPPPPAPPPPP